MCIADDQAQMPGPADDCDARRKQCSAAGSAHRVATRRAVSFALLLAGGLCGPPAIADQPSPATGPDGAGQSGIIDTGLAAPTPGLSLHLGGGDWQRAMQDLQATQWAQDTPSQPNPDAEASAAGGLLTDANEISRQSNNPLGGDFILWLNFINLDWQQGETTQRTRPSYSHLLQPVIPIKLPSLGENWILVNRPSIPFFYKQEVSQGPHPGKGDGHKFDNKSGVGDIEYLAMLGTSTPTDSGWLAESFGVGDAVVAAGFTTRFPTARDSLSQNVYAAGPAGTAAYIGKDWTFATLVQHWWDYSSQNNAEDFNFTRLQLFYYKSFPGGWLVGGSPKITADWSASNDDRWTVPVGLGAVKTVFFGDLPVRLGVELRPSLVRPDDLGTDWQIEFSIIPVTPNFVDAWLR